MNNEAVVKREAPGTPPNEGKRLRSIARVRWLCTALVFVGLGISGLSAPLWVFPVGIALLLFATTMCEEAEMKGYRQGFRAAELEVFRKQWDAPLTIAGPEGTAPSLQGSSPRGST